jgi:hypothetical protein
MLLPSALTAPWKPPVPLTTNAWTTQAPMPKAVIGAMPAVANNNLM